VYGVSGRDRKERFLGGTLPLPAPLLMNWGRLERTLSDGTETGLLDPSVEVERQR